MNFSDDTEQEMVEAIERFKKAKINLESAKEFIQDRMGAAETATYGHYKVDWRWVQGARRTDWKKIAAKLDAPAQMVDDHTVTGEPTRRFKIS